jgi:VIT1/CCC1 family predicted Fe2+/Mn2+ transporter
MANDASTTGNQLRRFLPELIYGSNDGLVTTFAIVSGVVGASLSNRVVLILGFASLFADGFSMGASSFLSERSKPEGRSSKAGAARNGAATFLGFVIVGAVPLIAYVLPIPEDLRFWTAGAMTLSTLFAVGAARGLVVDRIDWLRGGLEMLVVGAAAAGVAFGIGLLISGVR